MTYSYSTKKQFPIPYVVDLQGLVLIKNHSYAPEPPIEKESIVIWASHVLTPFSLTCIFHAFLDPLPKLSMKPTKLEKFFPCL